VGRLGDEAPADEIFEIPRHRPPSISRANLGRRAVPTLFDGFVLHKFAGETGPLFAHEELVIGGESGHFLEPLVRAEMIERVVATHQPSGEPAAVQPKRVGLPRNQAPHNDAEGLAT
jgi:hypothetical protein